MHIAMLVAAAVTAAGALIALILLPAGEPAGAVAKAPGTAARTPLVLDPVAA
jgi:preprotein translocase subunit SecG